MTQEMKKKTLKEASKKKNSLGIILLIGVLFLLTDLSLIFVGKISLYNLIIALPAVWFVRKQLTKWRVARSSANLQKYILDPKFRKEYNNK